MLRNLNRSSARGRICGTPHTGVLGSLIPSGGNSGPGFAYNDLVLPTDAGKEVCGRITSWPSAGTLFAWEDTSFIFSGAPDGTYAFQYQLYVDGVATGAPATVTLNVGSGDTTIIGIVGSATASGARAMLNLAVNAAVCNSTATGLDAAFTISADTLIACLTGDATAETWPAQIDVAVSAQTGNAISSGSGASIAFGGDMVIGCSVGNGMARTGAATISFGVTQASQANTHSGPGRIRVIKYCDTSKAAFEMNFTPKRPEETEVLAVDYAAILNTGETIVSAVWSNSVVSGADANPAAMVSGTASISGTTVSQRFTGGNNGTVYAPTCLATTSYGQTIVLPIPGTGRLAVKG